MWIFRYAFITPWSAFTWGCGVAVTSLDRWSRVWASFPIPRQRWRTPALRDSVRRLALNPTATARLCGPMLQRART